MFDKTELHEFFVDQEVRKAKLGKVDYQRRKLFEEIEELARAIAEVKNGFVSDNFIEELGDVLFCVGGDKALHSALENRLEFNWSRAQNYKRLEEAGIDYSCFKLTQQEGWIDRFTREPVSEEMRELLLCE